MRTTTTGEAKVLAGSTRSVFVRAKIIGADAATHDLTTLKGFNWLKSCTIDEAINGYVGTADLDLQREMGLGKLSLATLMAGSVLNTANGGKLVEIGREIIIDTATMPPGVLPAAADWHKAFHGYIDTVDWDSTPIKVHCRDLGGLLLQDAQIETEHAYGSWEALHLTIVGQVITPSGNPPNGQTTPAVQFWKATAITTGITGATEPTWPTNPSPGATKVDAGVTWTYQAAVAWSAGSARSTGAFTANPTNALQFWECIASGGVTGGANPFPAQPTQGQIVVDNQVTWAYWASLGGTPAETVIQSIINDALGAGVVTLNVPAASRWYLGPYVQSRDKLLQALTALTEGMGWDLRFAFSGSEAAGDFKLTLQAVTRAAPGVVATFAANQYFNLSKVSRAIADVRNAVRVVFNDSENLDGTTGQPTRKSVLVTDGTSIAAYKRRYMELAETSSTSITTTAMATVLANAALTDLKEPLLEAELELPYYWPIQLNDYITVKANSVHFDSDQSVAVISIRHSFDLSAAGSQAKERTVLGLRNLPTMGSQKHLDKEAGAGAALFTLATPVAASNLQLTQTIGGLKLSFNPPQVRGSKLLTPELHISATPAFTPSSSTLKDLGLKSSHTTADLTPGVTYYAAIVHRDQRGNIAAKSAEQTFVAGYTNFVHLNPAYTQNACGLAVSTTVHNDASNFPVTLDLQNYDQGGIFDPATGIFTVVTGGTFLFVFGGVITGGAIGDLVAMAVEWNNTLTWVVQRSSPYAMFQPTGAAGAAEAWCAMAFTKGGVNAGDQFRLACYPKPPVAGSTLTVTGGGLTQKAAHMAMTQLLTS